MIALYMQSETDILSYCQCVTIADYWAFSTCSPSGPLCADRIQGSSVFVRSFSLLFWRRRRASSGLNKNISYIFTKFTFVIVTLRSTPHNFGQFRFWFHHCFRQRLFVSIYCVRLCSLPKFHVLFYICLDLGWVLYSAYVGSITVVSMCKDFSGFQGNSFGVSQLVLSFRLPFF